MDGVSNGKPYEQMDDLGGKTTIFGNTHIINWKFSRKIKQTDQLVRQRFEERAINRIQITSDFKINSEWKPFVH